MPRLLPILLMCASEALFAKLASAVLPPDKPLVVMTFNIRYDNPGDGENAWQHRKDWVGEIVAGQKPDVVGFQEVVAGQLKDLQERLPEMTAYGVGRDDGKERGEFVPIFYRTKRFEKLDQGTFWLSLTPEKPGSKGWDAALPRITSWVKLKDRESGLTFVALNTHLDHRGEQARAESAKLLLRKLRADFADQPVILTGDFNTLPDSVPYTTLVGTVEQQVPEVVPLFRDSYVHSPIEPKGEASTWNGFKEIVPNQRIDFILFSGDLRVRHTQILENQRAGRFPSDHLPVVSEFGFIRPR